MHEDIPFLPPRSHISCPRPSVFHVADGASPSPARCQGTKEQIMLDLDLKNINSHSKPHRIYPSNLPPHSVDCCVPHVTYNIILSKKGDSDGEGNHFFHSIAK